MDCDYCSFTIKCHSRHGEISKIEKSEFFRRIKHNIVPLIRVAKYKFNFIANRLQNLNRINGFEVPPDYYYGEDEMSFESSEVDEPESGSEGTPFSTSNLKSYRV